MSYRIEINQIQMNKFPTHRMSSREQQFSGFIPKRLYKKAGLRALTSFRNRYHSLTILLSAFSLEFSLQIRQPEERGPWE